ncbi:hypothetical protein RUND412_002333 [Rhizina undulata]
MFDFLDPQQQRADGSGSSRNGVTWPLDIMSIILSYLDSPADLSRIARVSKIHHYLAIPLLYQEVTLRVTPHPPSRDRFPGNRRSPYSSFLSGLKTLQKPGIAGTVRKLVVVGTVMDYDGGGPSGGAREREEARWWETGMWGDLEGLLGLAVGGVLGSMDRLETFVSLARHPSIRYLEISHPKPPISPPCSFPPRPLRPPLTVIPSMLNLHSLRLIDQSVAPYSDDFTPLIFSSPALKSLTISWRTETVLSQLVFNQQLRQVLVGRHPKRLQLIEVGFNNMFLDGAGDIGELFETTALRKIVLLDCDVSENSWKELFLPEQAGAENPAMAAALAAVSVGGSGSFPRFSGGSEVSTPTNKRSREEDTPTPPASASSSTTSSGTLHGIPHGLRNRKLNLKYFKTNMLGRRYISLLESFEGLEELYIIDKDLNSEQGRELKEDYMQAIFSRHGRTLKKLRLTAKWVLDRDEISRLIRACTGLNELGLALEHDELYFLKVLVPFLPKISLVHILDSPFCFSPENPTLRLDNNAKQYFIGTAVANPDYQRIRWIGLGDLRFRIDRDIIMDPDGVRRKGVTVVDRRELEDGLKGRGVFGALSDF